MDPSKAKALDLGPSIDFLNQVWVLSLKWGNQRMEYIGRSLQQLADFLKGFNSKNEIHDLNIFSEKLEKYVSSKLSINPRTSPSLNEVLRLTELLTKFHSIRIKTAALIMRFICLDCNFLEVDKSKLIPPLDRVNYRMCEQLLGRKYTLEKLGESKATFGKKATIAFDNIGKDVLGKNKVLIDNLWFIGHFYHGTHRTNCQIREGAEIIESPYLQDIRLQPSCPFSECGYKRAKIKL